MDNRLSNGSPIPIKTILVSFALSGIDNIWFVISLDVRLPDQPCFPVMQNKQFILQPTWHDTHSVALSSSGMYTVSILPCSVLNKYFVVPSILSALHIGSDRPIE